ncbi:MAG TPA: tail fiber domain-containing protein [Steroidobacteraceae bacterium]|nr:tail fiber domain-containing protein [Steroidobacteraceae bacterium]
MRSPRRYKQDIEPLGDASERLYGLRPVKFRYIKPDEQGEKPLQFGLIAEEVAAVLPELVYRWC